MRTKIENSMKQNIQRAYNERKKLLTRLNVDNCIPLEENKNDNKLIVK